MEPRDTPPGPRPRRAPIRSVTEQVAYELRNHIQLERMQPGDRLGREEDLAEAYRVSRPTMREALRLLSSAGLLRADRGPGGGISVVRTVEDGISHAVAGSIAAMLDVEAISIRQLVDARLLFEPAIARLAAERIDDDDAAELADVIATIEPAPADKAATIQAADTRFHRAVARASGNLMLHAIIDWAFEVLQPRLYELSRPMTRQDFLPQHGAILDALIAHDPDAAEQAMREHLEHVRGIVIAAGEQAAIAPPATRRPGGEPASRGTSTAGAAERTAHALRAHIQSSLLAPGDRIGREEELMARFHVSRPVLREALRLLASANLIRTSRGPGGGVFVAHTFEDGMAKAVTDTVALLLETGAITVAELFEARIAIEVALAGAAALGDAAENGETDAGEHAAVNACTPFHRAIARATANPIVAGVTDWIWNALQPEFDALIEHRAGESALVEQHRAILAAIEARDAHGAKQAMHEHLLHIRALLMRPQPQRPSE